MSARDTYSNFRSAGFYSEIGAAAGTKAWTPAKTSCPGPHPIYAPLGVTQCVSQTSPAKRQTGYSKVQRGPQIVPLLCGEQRKVQQPVFA